MTTNNQPNWKAAFFTRCPNCGKGRIFAGFIKLADHCNVCQLDLKQFETADGPAFFASCIVGTLVGIGAAIFELANSPPLWLHLVIWTPVTFIGSFVIIRITKAVMIAHQIKLHK